MLKNRNPMACGDVSPGNGLYAGVHLTPPTIVVYIQLFLGGASQDLVQLLAVKTVLEKAVMRNNCMTDCLDKEWS